MSSTPPPSVTWTSTTEASPWRRMPELRAGAIDDLPDVLVEVARPAQRIEGFGAAFSELGWDALSALTEEQRQEILHELFAPGAGADLSICRTPIGANDFSRDWYSYDEVDGDLDLEHFSIDRDRDRESLIPFIRSAQAHRPDLRLWASPWSPPAWMKTNGHYAGAASTAGPRSIDNGLRPEQAGREGTDMLVQDEAHLAAYARYFGRFIDAYRAEGIDIGMVMPQNEFNSPQTFPSCTWTPEGLARFIAHLGPEMRHRAVQVFLGTFERADDRLLTRLLDDPSTAAFVDGVGVQWAGGAALPFLHHDRPDLVIYQTEQECGDGLNDWRHCRHAWTLLRHSLRHGATAHLYWNTALPVDGRSRWGRPQNSLVTVDTAAGTYRYNHEHHLLKHVSHFVHRDARVLPTLSLNGFDDQLAFRNADGSIVVVIANGLRTDQPVRIGVGDALVSVTLPADSFNTLVVPPPAA